MKQLELPAVQQIIGLPPWLIRLLLQLLMPDERSETSDAATSIDFGALLGLGFFELVRTCGTLTHDQWLEIMRIYGPEIREAGNTMQAGFEHENGDEQPATVLFIADRQYANWLGTPRYYNLRDGCWQAKLPTTFEGVSYNLATIAQSLRTEVATWEKTHGSDAHATPDACQS